MDLSIDKYLESSIIALVDYCYGSSEGMPFDEEITISINSEGSIYELCIIQKIEDQEELRNFYDEMVGEIAFAMHNGFRGEIISYEDFIDNLGDTGIPYLFTKETNKIVVKHPYVIIEVDGDTDTENSYFPIKLDFNNKKAEIEFVLIDNKLHCLLKGEKNTDRL